MKYELIKLTKEHNLYNTGVNYQIRALADFADIEKGDLGGYVNNGSNLSQEGSCWLYDNSKMFGNSRMYNNSKMFDNSRMFDNSEMYNNSEMYDSSVMYDDSTMFDDSIMYDDSKMHNNSIMHNDSMMYDDSRMYNTSKMFDDSEMQGSSKMLDNSMMFYNARIQGTYELKNKALRFPKLYKYISYPIFDTKNKKPTHIRMGCFTRTIKEWQDDFYNNDKEFPKGSDDCNQRLLAINYILLYLGEDLITGE